MVSPEDARVQDPSNGWIVILEKSENFNLIEEKIGIYHYSILFEEYRYEPDNLQFKEERWDLRDLNEYLRIYIIYDFHSQKIG